ncbi:PREDICTED: enoyl-CoA delta isomerase 3-like [Branchiostoma belcheri]|uniref:Enoyl-CoA delta isomerase 3-like n=1 Tax=Branchiostoma belcheri TaxID=7741 RepID=A0A6P4YJX1_BRABE|nr:PREDICTED: enoyl-CoA delta isomerase 3-like [Branchiostoma belcheri]XP_019629731.1 PREDICTED: enoyl-CoA delta isomerase 3-like [Branchiostoma belcheri]
MASGKFRVEVRGKIAVVTTDCGENRFNLDFVNKLNKALDEVESNPNVQAVITTGIGKFFSNGLDVNWMGQVAKNNQVSELIKFFEGIHALNRRMITFPVPTIAAINGHCVAQGGFWALHHDYRLMRTKRSWFSLPEVHLKLPIGEHNIKLVRMKVNGDVARDSLVFGKWYSPEESLQAGFVDQLAEPEELLESAIKFAHQCLGTRGFDRGTLKAMKENVYKDLLDVEDTMPDLNRYTKLAKPKL